MEEIKYSFIISPERLKGDIFQKNFNGFEFGSYSAMTKVLTSGPNGDSLLTGLTVPILFTQTYNDIGYYDEFEGFIAQQDTINNFIISGNTTNPYQITLLNSAGFQLNNFLAVSNYNIDWGDGSSGSTLNVRSNIRTHNYQTTPAVYQIKMTQNNIWGTTTIIKDVFLPHTGVTVDNVLGNVTFTQQGGNWSGIPIDYNYIFTGDSNNNVSNHVSSNYTTIPFIVSGFTNSRLNLLRRWGPNQYTIGYIQKIGPNNVGYLEQITDEFTSYTINNISYFDFPNNSTIFFVNSSGFTSDNLVASALTKNETLLDFVMDPEIQSDVVIERGKYSAQEGLQRLGEIDNIGDLVNYGYGFFKINET
jgi:hypothetical protein